MARSINSFEQFVSANEDLRKYYDNARSTQNDTINRGMKKALDKINLSKPPTAQDEWHGVRDEPENPTNAKIGNTWEYKPEETKPEVKNKINHNITDL